MSHCVFLSLSLSQQPTVQGLASRTSCIKKHTQVTTAGVTLESRSSILQLWTAQSGNRQVSRTSNKFCSCATSLLQMHLQKWCRQVSLMPRQCRGTRSSATRSRSSIPNTKEANGPVIDVNIGQHCMFHCCLREDKHCQQPDSKL